MNRRVKGGRDESFSSAGERDKDSLSLSVDHFLLPCHFAGFLLGFILEFFLRAENVT